MSFWILILLGIIQGLTEFLPISSSGHLILLYNFFGIQDNTMLLSIIFHVATLLAVIVYYRREIWQLISHPLCTTNLRLISTTLVTCVVALVLKPFIDRVFAGDYLSTFFMLTAIILFVSDIYKPKSHTPKSLTFDICNLPISPWQSLIIGFAQGIACIPGISRSGSTIATAKILGLKEHSSTYSFLISIPIILASLLLEIMSGGTIGSINLWWLAIAFLVCFLCGIFSIKLMTNFVNKNRLIVFSIYLTILAIFLTLNSLLLHFF